MGIATTEVKEGLKNCDILILEANHDLDMLENGPYPLRLKKRIKSKYGHLSNKEALELFMSLDHDKLSHLVLAHLSQEKQYS